MPANTRRVLTLALGDLRRGWRGLLIIDLVCKALAAIFFVPLIVAGARFLIASSGSDAVADQAIISFLLSPLGLLTLLAVGTAQIGFFALEFTALLAGASQAAQGQRATATQALGFAFRHAPRVLALAGRVWVRILLIAAPFLGACGVVYLTLLTKFDINYYLAERPPIFVVSVALAAGLLLVMAWILVPRVISWGLALPLMLFEDVPPREAMALSLARMRTDSRTVRRTLGVWALCSVLVSTVAFGVVAAIARWIAPPLVERIGLLLLALGFVLALWAIAHLLANLAISAGLAVLGTRLHEHLREHSGGMAGELTRNEAGGTVAHGSFGLSTRALAGLLIGSMIGAVVFGAYLLRGVRLDTRVEIIAHRGASGAAPENTVAAFDAAVDQATDWVELDVQEDTDGTVVVMHDSDFMKLARNSLKVWESTTEQRAGIDIGSWFGPQFAAERVPTLEDVLLRCKGRTKVVIELKYYGHDQRLEERVADIVERTGMQDQIVAMSLNHDIVRKMKKLRPNWTVGLLTATAIGNVPAMEGDFLAVSTGMATPSFVRAAHSAGKDVFVWTVNDPMTMALMVTRGADGLITDEPAVARRVLQRMDAASFGQRALLGLAVWLGIEPKATDTARDIN